MAPVLVLLIVGASPASAAASWGNSGAAYDGGILCSLPDGIAVPMARWLVDGSEAFALADVVGYASSEGPAPVTGAASPMRAGQAGFDRSAIAAAAYLIAHHGAGSAADVAEVSADLALATGGGGVQARCLGQQGTSARHAATLWTQAQRFAGPYTLDVTVPPHPLPGRDAVVTVAVRSAAGFPVPGLSVTVVAGGASTSTVTDGNGSATATIRTPASVSAPVTATVREPTGLTYVTSNPAAIEPAGASTYTGRATLTPVLHPHPAVSVTAGAALLLPSGRTTPEAHVTGTYGYAGVGTITVAGPLPTPSGGGCGQLGATDFAPAPAAWSGTFAFTGDGDYDVGAVSGLAAGCYSVRSSVRIPGSRPPATADSGYSDGAAITVSPVQLHVAAASPVAAAGRLTADVTVTEAGAATVTSTLTAYGPLTTRAGRCPAGLDWSAAPAAAVSDPVAVASAGAASAARPVPISTPAVRTVGCYALAMRHVVSLDGHQLVLEDAVGRAGTTTLVVRPTVTVANDSYDGEVGQAMHGIVTVAGTYGFRGTVSVTLTPVAAGPTGCHDAPLPAASADPVDTPSGAPSTVTTAGDGSFAFVTPLPRRNACYAVTASLRLLANPAVAARSTPDAAAVFLAGITLRPLDFADVASPPDPSALRALITAVLAAALMLGTAGGVIARTARAHQLS